MHDTEISHGRDGNLTSIINAAAKFDGIRNSFKGIARDLQDEQKSTEDEVVVQELTTNHNEKDNIHNTMVACCRDMAS
jgi:hypothetical protein